MKEYIRLVQNVLHRGERRPNRTGTPVIGLFSENFTHDLRDGYPLLTSKAMNYRSIFAELVGFLRGYTSAADFRQLGTNIWNRNANEDTGWLANPARKGEDDLGPIYGSQWRGWRDGSLRIDQFTNLIDGLRNDPYGRRHLVSAWNVADMGRMALPPCHVLFQCYVSNDGHLDLQMYQRSCDVFLGLPFNIASYAALTHLIASLTGLKPRMLHIVTGDTHVYVDHIEKALEQCARSFMALPELTIGHVENLAEVHPGTFQVHGYESHPALSAPMAVAK